MRLSEKTIELNICAQINQNLRSKILWFGLTQAQEAKSGFDAATRLHGRILLFQFKASNLTMVGTGARRFSLEHDQLQTLINQIHGFRRSVFYIFPLIGDTHELNYYRGDFFGNTWALDVSTLPNPFPLPTTNTIPTRLRVNRKHYGDVIPPSIKIHSDPVEAKIESIKSIVESNFAGADGLNSFLLENSKNYDKAFSILEPFKKNTKMAVLYD